MKENYPWLKHYPTSVAHEIDADKFASLGAMLEYAFAQYADNTHCVHMDTEFTYRQIDEFSQQFGAYFQHETGLKPGDRVAVQMPNCPQYFVALFGLLRAGYVVVNTNPLYTEREMLHQFNDAEVRAVVMLAHFADKLENVLSNTGVKHVILTQLGDLMPTVRRTIVNAAIKYVKKMIPSFDLPQAVKFRDVLKKGQRHTFKPVEVQPEDIAFLQYTGGTTGVSKGAMLTHRNILANLMQTSEWMSPRVSVGREMIVTALPLYHIFSLTINCFLFTYAGCANLLITNPRDIKAFVKDLQKHPFTAITAVNTLYNGLLNNEDFRKLDFSKLKLAVAGGMALQSAVSQRWKEVTGTPIAEGYGLTESSPVISCNDITGNERVGTVGLVMPSTEMRILDEELNELPQGERGEICAKGPQIMKGYWNRPDETAKTLQDGWLRTGDIGIMDEEGYFRIVDRKKEMILVSGFNVYPNEVEDVLTQHPGVLEAAAIGVPDPKSTEAVKAFIVKKDESLTDKELRAFCEKHLTGYKRPKHYEFRKDLPKSNVGKILRRLLRDAEVKQAENA